MIVALLVCLVHACSNDVDGVLGDEALAWTPAAGATQYEVCRTDESACVVTAAPELLVAGTSLVAAPTTAYLKVRACDCHNPALPCACSAWDVPVEFVPYACLRGEVGGCEFPCYQGAARRLPNFPECP